MHSIKGTVSRLIKKHDTNDPFKIARQKNIEIVFESLGGTLGYYSSHKRFKFIHINNTIGEGLKRFVCAHELGHAVLHLKTNTPFLKNKTFFSVDKIEVEANTFAVELLMQDEIIYEYKNTNLSLCEISEIYGVPKELAHLKNINRGE